VAQTKTAANIAMAPAPTAVFLALKPMTRKCDEDEVGRFPGSGD